MSGGYRVRKSMAGTDYSLDGDADERPCGDPGRKRRDRLEPTPLPQ